MSMDFSLLGMKELYQVALKATSDMKIGNREIKSGEPITTFEKIQFGGITEVKKHVSATGGYGNQAWVTWSSTKEVKFDFTQGVFSAVDLALLGNSYIERDTNVSVPMVEDLNVNEQLEVRTKYPPIEDGVYIYEDESGKRLDDFVINENVITLNGVQPYSNVKVLYNFDYSFGVRNIVIGRTLVKGFLELSGKTRLKDDETGQEVTGIIKIPRLKLESDLSIILGKNVPPVVASFHTIGYPVGSKGNERVMELILLNDDIDSDF